MLHGRRRNHTFASPNLSFAGSQSTSRLQSRKCSTRGAWPCIIVDEIEVVLDGGVDGRQQIIHRQSRFRSSRNHCSLFCVVPMETKSFSSNDTRGDSSIPCRLGVSRSDHPLLSFFKITFQTR